VHCAWPGLHLFSKVAARAVPPTRPLPRTPCRQCVCKHRRLQAGVWARRGLADPIGRADQQQEDAMKHRDSGQPPEGSPGDYKSTTVREGNIDSGKASEGNEYATGQPTGEAEGNDPNLTHGSSFTRVVRGDGSVEPAAGHDASDRSDP
jgi:hypothetical protein